MQRWKTVDYEFVSGMQPHFRTTVTRLPVEGYEVRVHLPSEVPDDPVILREWADVLQAAAEQLDDWQKEALLQEETESRSVARVAVSAMTAEASSKPDATPAPTISKSGAIASKGGEMNLCPKCQNALWDRLAREVSVVSDFAFSSDQAFMLLMVFGIHEQDFYGAMSLRGWYCCAECNLWTRQPNEEGLCPECPSRRNNEAL